MPPIFHSRWHHRRLGSQEWSVTTLGGNGEASEPDPHQDSLSQCQLRRLKQRLPLKSVLLYNDSDSCYHGRHRRRRRHRRHRRRRRRRRRRHQCFSRFLRKGEDGAEQNEDKKKKSLRFVLFVFRIFFLSNFNDFETKYSRAILIFDIHPSFLFVNFERKYFLIVHLLPQSLSHSPTLNPILAESLFKERFIEFRLDIFGY